MRKFVIHSKVFERDNTIALGVCNGCQMMSHIKEIIPGTDLWPTFIKNESEQLKQDFYQLKLRKITRYSLMEWQIALFL